MALLIILAFAILCIGINAAIHFSQKKKSETARIETESPRVLKTETIAAPEGLYYDKSHSWAFMKQNGRVKVGIDDFLLKVTGNLTRVDLLKEGEKVRKGDTLVTIAQNGKRLSIKSPVSGIVKAQNSSLEKNSGRIKSSPYVQGWLYEIEPANWMREIQLLLIGDTYKNWINNEVTRLKDFMAGIMSQKELAPGVVALQDGGELTEDILSQMAPEEWEMFQTDFLDKAK